MTLREILLMTEKIPAILWEFCVFASFVLSQITVEFVMVLVIYVFIKGCEVLIDSRNDYYNEVQAINTKNRVKMFILNILLIPVLKLIIAEFPLPTFFNKAFVFRLIFILLEFKLISDMFRQVMSIVHAYKGFRWEMFTTCILIVGLIHNAVSLGISVYMVYHIYPNIRLFLLFYLFIKFNNLIKSLSKLVNYLSNTYIIDSIEPIRYEINEDDENADEHICVICRDQMQEAIRLTCGHEFHKACIKEWLSKSTVCPICRSHVSIEETPTEQLNQNENIHRNVNIDNMNWEITEIN